MRAFVLYLSLHGIIHVFRSLNILNHYYFDDIELKSYLSPFRFPSTARAFNGYDVSACFLCVCILYDNVLYIVREKLGTEPALQNRRRQTIDRMTRRRQARDQKKIHGAKQ